MAATAYLLKGLSTSPALKTRDYETFYHQLADTHGPGGSWFVLWGRDGQILNTTQPFGATLPTLSQADMLPATVERIRDSGLLISDRTISALSRQPVVAVHLRLDDPDGTMNGFLSTVLPEEQLNAVAREGGIPSGWTNLVLDRNLAPIASTRAVGGSDDSRLLPALRDGLRGSPSDGIFALEVTGSKVLVAVHRSVSTDYTTVTIVPNALVHAPVDAAWRKILSTGLALLLAGVAAGTIVVRQVGPVEKLAALTARRLRLAEARYTSLWEDTPESLFVVTVTAAGRFVFEGLNPAHERATGLTFEAIAGKEPEDCLPPETAAAVLARYRHCVANGRPEIYDEVLDLPGGRRYWQTSLSPVHDPDTGRIILLVGTARDVTDDREARARIEDSQRLLQSTLDALSAHVAILDSNGVIIAVNRAWQRVAAEGVLLTPANGIGRNYVAICRAAAANHPMGKAMADGLSRVLNGKAQEFKTSYESNGRSFHLSAAGFPFGGSGHVVVANEDVSELMSARQDVRTIADRLLSLQEEERQRIAGDLHDSTAQHIVAAELSLMHVQAVAGDTKQVEEAVAIVRASLDEAQREIRTLSYLLYPPNLRSIGLSASLRQFVEGFSSRTGLRGTARVAGPVDQTPIEVQRSILRVVQEALVNVHRHAQANKVTVSLKVDGGFLRLKIADDGKGLRLQNQETGADATRLGVGIPGMEARIRQLGGSLRIQSGKSGTAILAAVPITPTGDAREVAA